MTNLPIELANAREASTEAWNAYQLVVGSPHTSAEFHQALHAAGVADKLCADLYARWQAVGGTSDIESIEAAELEQERHKALQIVLDVTTAPVVTRPTYDELIHGAKFTDEHRAELQDWWNKKYDNKEEAKRLNVLR